MKKFVLISSIFFIIGGTMAFEILSSSGKAGYTNSPGEGNCTNCHSGTLNAGPGSVAITSSPSLEEGYTIGATYVVTVTVTNSATPNNTRFGFAFESLFDSGANGGTLTITDSNLTQIKTTTVNSNTRNTIVHTGSGNTGPDSQQFSFEWTAPETAENPVTFYAVGNAANNNGNSFGDNIYSVSLDVKANTTGISENFLQNNITVYPNPSNGRFQLAIGENQDERNYNLMIINLEGKIIYQSVVEKSNTNIDLSEFAKGNYYLKVFNEENNLTKKISIQ